MSSTKALLFSSAHVALAEFASALSHPARIQIIMLIQEHGRLSCGDLVDVLPLAQATVSQHIKMLLDAGLLLRHPEGLKMYYELDCDKLQKFCHNFQCTLKTLNPES